MSADCAGCRLLAGLRAAAHPDLVAELPAAWLLLGEHQALPGYAVLWSKLHVRELHELPPEAYTAFMADLRRASLAVAKAGDCWKLNTAVLGNAVGHAHAHLFPRSAMDPERLRHPWVHEAAFGEPGTPQQRRAAIERIRQALQEQG
jgi:diadenosine tetraphosphate (Ap4A) HIT family hydrolase